MFFKILSKLYSYESREMLLSIKRAIRSKWLQPQFKSCGKATRFEKIGNIIGAKYITIGELCYFTSHFHITAWKKTEQKPELIIGDNCDFGAYNHITCTNKIVIGDNFLSGKWVTITDNSHGESTREMMECTPSSRPVVSKGSVVIGKNVWVGEKATILPGVTIGDGCVIAANAVVTNDVPAYCVVAGIPAIVVKNNSKSSNRI